MRPKRLQNTLDSLFKLILIIPVRTTVAFRQLAAILHDGVIWLHYTQGCVPLSFKNEIPVAFYAITRLSFAYYATHLRDNHPEILTLCRVNLNASPREMF